jgi:hypothetical protein
VGITAYLLFFLAGVGEQVIPELTERGMTASGSTR